MLEDILVIATWYVVIVFPAAMAVGKVIAWGNPSNEQPMNRQEFKKAA